jgi:hypothetical protein
MRTLYYRIRPCYAHSLLQDQALLCALFIYCRIRPCYAHSLLQDQALLCALFTAGSGPAMRTPTRGAKAKVHT